MVVTHLYTCTGTEIGTKIGRYGDKREAIHPDAYLSGLVGWLVVGSFHFGSFHFGSVRLSD